MSQLLTAMVFLIGVTCLQGTAFAFGSRSALRLPTQSRAGSDPKRRYITVGIAGFRTSKADPNNIYSNDKGDSAFSGPWAMIPTSKENDRISASVYLTHFAEDAQLEAVLNLFKAEDHCRDDLGLIIMGVSWGINNTAKLADLYLQQCGYPPDLVISIDGVYKPIPFAFDGTIPSDKCLNFYETNSFVHGGPLESCKNFSHDELDQLISFEGNPIIPSGDHVDMETVGSVVGHMAILKYVKIHTKTDTKDDSTPEWLSDILR